MRTDETGTASLEFITAGLVLLVPLVYLVLTVAALQGASFAVEGASRQAARVFVESSSVAEAQRSARVAVEFALADYDLDADDVRMTVTCTPNPGACLTRRGFVTVEVTTAVALPLVPPVLDLDVPLSVPIASSTTQQVSRFGGVAP
ncbi:hypothetical protein GCM10027413_24320 [Conyzicola nivalis]|uniref:TadE family protein n=1 Tax=Conyzicola nivalis TaxID=1477021 RepID=A0A916WET8_9MICO|nr:hypothetical protein [Conyzicola nivalis]GGA91182.1 hypothetical protein GCM10010979_02300 [Conyzicola nivalis]